MTLLDVQGLSAGYGDVGVLHDLDFQIADGGVVALLGPNGAGKTTLLKSLSGLLSRRSGRADLKGDDLMSMHPEATARHGMAHVPEGRGTLTDLSVEDNLRVGGYLRSSAEVQETMKVCFDYFPVLADRRTQQAGNLSGGEQQMLAISRGLMLRPRLMLLDEPSLGLAPNLTRQLFAALGQINHEQSVAMLIVEQNASLALDLASTAYVLESGRIVLAGTADDIKGDTSLRKAYLGY
jgi:branched-chain amino acid transport system ATP-binding protein